MLLKMLIGCSITLPTLFYSYSRKGTLPFTWVSIGSSNGTPVLYEQLYFPLAQLISFIGPLDAIVQGVLKLKVYALGKRNYEKSQFEASGRISLKKTRVFL